MQLTKQGQDLEDAATMRRISRELEKIVPRLSRSHAESILHAVDDCARIASSMDGKR